LADKTFKLSFLGVVLLVMLRVAIGWHFFYEGMWKHQHSEFSAEPYFLAAKGPFAASYRDMIPDLYGQARLDASWLQANWDAYRVQAAAHYGFDDKQQAESESLLKARHAQAAEYLDGIKSDLKVYQADLERLEAAEADATTRDIPFQQKRIANRRTELLAKSKPWVAEVESIAAAYRSDLDRLATDEQRSKGGVPLESKMLDWIDWLTVWTCLWIGFLLMVGLFTRAASVVGAGFLLLVILAQPALPNVYPPPHPSVGHSMLINKEVIEMIALLAVGAVGAGRWGGLDFLVHHFVTSRICCRKKQS